jgi:hypothetical protein
MRYGDNRIPFYIRACNYGDDGLERDGVELEGVDGIIDTYETPAGKHQFKGHPFDPDIVRGQDKGFVAG